MMHAHVVAAVERDGGQRGADLGLRQVDADRVLRWRRMVPWCVVCRHTLPYGGGYTTRVKRAATELGPRQANADRMF